MTNFIKFDILVVIPQDKAINLENTEKLKKDKLSLIIKDMILSGAFLSGERLPPERELAMSFGVSRPAVHDALLQVQADGLVKMRPRHGCVVRDFSSLPSISILTELYLNNRLNDSKKIESGLVEFRQMILEKIIEKLLLKIKKLSEQEKHNFFSPLENLLDFSLQDYTIQNTGKIKIKNKVNTKEIDVGEIDTEKIAFEDFNFYCKLIELSEEPVFLMFFKMAETIYIHQVSEFLKENLSYIKMIPEYKKEFLEVLKMGNKNKAVKMMKILTDPETYRRSKYAKDYLF